MKEVSKSAKVLLVVISGILAVGFLALACAFRGLPESLIMIALFIIFILGHLLSVFWLEGLFITRTREEELRKAEEDWATWYREKYSTERQRLEQEWLQDLFVKQRNSDWLRDFTRDYAEAAGRKTMEDARILGEEQEDDVPEEDWLREQLEEWKAAHRNVRKRLEGDI